MSSNKPGFWIIGEPLLIIEQLNEQSDTHEQSRRRHYDNYFTEFNELLECVYIDY
ncbi:hypothetical protein VCR4J2_280001 [Vibrio coralliirubri]|nr:hypothetical protein VCR4J2_280001 [Vibrio coralliirubri]